MKTLIVYASKHGTTEKVALQIQQSLNNDVQLLNLKQSQHVDLALFDRVVIGGSIHAGTIQSVVKKFCTKNLVELLQKRVALFMCGMNKPELQAEFDRAFPELLRSHAMSCKMVGGEFIIEKMNFIDRLLVKKITGVTQTVSSLNQEEIDGLVRDMIERS